MDNENQQKSTLLDINSEENSTEVGSKHQQLRTIMAKKLFLDCFQKTLGIVSVATQKTGIERTTVYLWRRTDVEFKSRMDETEADVLEGVENMLKLAIIKGDGPSVRFWLSRRHPDYKTNKCNHVPIKNLYENLTEEERLEKLKNILAHYGMTIVPINSAIPTNDQ